jgi:ferritin-like protein
VNINLNQEIMGLFGKNQKKIIEELHKKSEDHSKEITKEINELLDELKTDYDENDEVVAEFSTFVEEIKTKLSPEDANKLLDFSSRLSKVKRCAKKGVDAMRELARDQRKLTSETRMEYEEYFYTR